VNELPLAWLVAAGVTATAGLVLGLVMLRRRRRGLGHLLRSIAWQRLKDVIVPDDVDGEIHLDLALLTDRGILLLEIREVSGTLFWGEHLEQWTVLDGARRTVLRNPLPALQARRHAVRAIAPQVPVEARLLLVGPVQISGGSPPGVMLREELVVAFPAHGKQRPTAPLQQAWDTLKAASRPA
jgi:hypothetical protein